MIRHIKPGYTNFKTQALCREMHKKRMKEAKEAADMRKKQPKEEYPAKPLIDALKFVLPAQKRIGPVQYQHCAISGGWIAATNEFLTIGTKIDVDIIGCPQTQQFLSALEKTKEELNITQLSEFSISVKSGNFKALIPCISLRDFYCLNGPDEPTIEVNNNIKEALDSIVGLAVENSKFAYTQGVCLTDKVAISTNRCTLMEYWHGLSLPREFLIHRTAAIAVGKTAKVLKAIGYSNSSITFHFEDESFIKSQLYCEKFPSYDKLFVKSYNDAILVPEEFFKAVDMIKDFTEKNGAIFLKNDSMASNSLEDHASTYLMQGLTADMSFNTKFLKLVQHAFIKACFDPSTDAVYFYGNNIRGVLKAIGYETTSMRSAESFPNENEVVLSEDDIPF
jgi:hypothetical protein